MHMRAGVKESAPHPLALPDEAQVAAATQAFALLAEPTRLRLLWLLADGEHDVGTLATAVAASPTAVSQQLAKLRLAGLVESRRYGRRQVYRSRGGHVVRLVREALYQADHLVSGEPPHP